jgi:hypothetical protein
MLPAGRKMPRRKHQLYGPVMMQIAAFLENALFWDITAVSEENIASISVLTNKS